MLLSEITVEAAQPLLGTVFRVAIRDGSEIKMTLTDVIPYEVRQRYSTRISVKAPRRQPFSLYFLGPPSPILPQAMYTFRAENAELESLFIVPIGQDDEGTEYEAVFT